MVGFGGVVTYVAIMNFGGAAKLDRLFRNRGGRKCTLLYMRIEEIVLKYVQFEGRCLSGRQNFVVKGAMLGNLASVPPPSRRPVT